MPIDEPTPVPVPPATRLWRWRSPGGPGKVESIFFATPEEIQSLVGQIRYGHRVTMAQFTEIDLSTVSRVLSGVDLFRD